MKMFDAGKTRMIGLPYDEKNCDDMLSRFHPIPGRYGRTDGRTDRIAISMSRVNVLTRDKNVTTELFARLFCLVQHKKLIVISVM